MYRKGLSSTVKIGGIALLAVLLVAGLAGFALFGPIEGTGLPSDQQDVNDRQDEVTGPWADSLVKKDVRTRDKASNDVAGGDIRVFEPVDGQCSNIAGWNEANEIDNHYSDAYSSYSIDSDAITTIQEKPGNWCGVVTNGTYYTEFVEISIPDGSAAKYDGTTLNEYNQAPETQDVVMAEVYSLGSAKTIDLDVSSNQTGVSKDYSGFVTYQPDSDTEYRANYLVLQTGDVNPLTDSDSDGTYDEGVSVFTIEVSGSGNTVSDTVFRASSGLDDLGSDEKVRVDIGETFTRDNDMTVTGEATLVNTEDGTVSADGDEKLSDGENIFDYNMCDVEGNCNSVGDITG